MKKDRYVARSISIGHIITFIIIITVVVVI